MGRLTLQSLIEDQTEDNALMWHLTSNFYPPLPSSLVPVAKRAIAKARKNELYSNVSLRDTGVTYKGKKLAPVQACMDEWRLWDFVG